MALIHSGWAVCLPCWVRGDQFVVAGSEQQPISKALGWLVEEEGKRINMSLSALGNAIEALADPSGPIACQDSMLALALQVLAFRSHLVTLMPCWKRGTLGNISSCGGHEQQMAHTLYII